MAAFPSYTKPGGTGDAIYHDANGAKVTIKSSDGNSTWNVECENEKQKPKFRRIGDLIYFEEFDKLIPIRKLPADVRDRILKELK